MRSRMNIFSESIGDLFPLLIIIGVGVALSGPVLGQPLPGVDAPFHLAKITRLSTFFPSLPAWFPWWYCGTPLLKTYPPLMYVTNISLTSLFHLEPWLTLGIIDTVCFVLTGCFIYLFLRKIGLHELACLSSSILYLSSSQTLSGRFGYGIYAHTFAMLFLVSGIYLAAKTHSSKYYEICLASILCLMVLSHLTVAVAFVGMLLTYYIGSFFAKLIDARNEKNHQFPFLRTLFGVIFGVFLSAFWIIPYLIEGGAGATAFMGSTANLAPSLQSFFLFNSQDIWLQSYYLGIPLIIFGLLGLLVSLCKRVFWGLVFISWTFFFLFMCMQPYIFQGLALGYPNRYPFFLSFSFSLLGAIVFDYFFRKISNRFSRFSLRVFFRSVLILLLVSYAVSVNPVIIKGYEFDNRVAEELTLYLGPYERLASINTFSYSFNVVSNRFQIDGGYIEGNINMQFYRKYWFEIYSGHDVEATIDILKRINARLVVFHGQIPYEVEKKFVPPYFSIILKEPPITVFELNRTLFPLNFVEVVGGKGDEVQLSYTNPDVLGFTLLNCSENTEIIVKMNYHEGWAAYCSDKALPLLRTEEGFMNLLIPFEGDVKVKLLYGSTLADHVGMGVTIGGIVVCIFLILRKHFKSQIAAKFSVFRKIEKGT
jgi:hypothetical protein